jgi:hypothetical protein
MTIALYLLARLVIAVVFIVISRAVVKLLRLDERFLKLVHVTLSDRRASGLALLMSGLMGLIAVSGWEVFHVDQRLHALLPYSEPAKPDRTATKSQLETFYVEGQQLLYRNFPPNTTETDKDFQKYITDFNEFQKRLYNWAASNMGTPAAARIFDYSTAPSMSWDRARNRTQNNIINMLIAIQRNLQVVIESDAWDTPVPHN